MFLIILDFKYNSAIILLRNKPLPYVAGRFFIRCIMSKPFKIYEEQIEILLTRALDINSTEDAKNILSQVNYYNLINGYKTPFLDNKSSIEVEDVYKAASSFEEIYALHEMDRELK